jgi:hypothetical protein
MTISFNSLSALQTCSLFLSCCWAQCWKVFWAQLKVLPLDLATSRLPFLWIPIKFTPKNSLKNHGSLWPNGLMNLSHRRPIFFNSRTGRKVCYRIFRVLTFGSYLSLCLGSLMMGFELLSTVILWSPALGSFLDGVKVIPLARSKF